MPSVLAECMTVNNVIDLMIKLRESRPPGPVSSDRYLRHMQAEVEVERALAAALAYYGPVSHSGVSYLGGVPVRAGQMFLEIKTTAAELLRWPPRDPDAKIAGHICNTHF